MPSSFINDTSTLCHHLFLLLLLPFLPFSNRNHHHHHHRPRRAATIVACVIPPSLSIATIVSSNPFSSCRMYYHLKLCSLELKNLISSHSFILSGFSLPLSHHHFVCALLSLSLYLGSRKEDNIHSASLARSKAFHFPNAQALVPIFPC